MPVSAASSTSARVMMPASVSGPVVSKISCVIVGQLTKLSLWASASGSYFSTFTAALLSYGTPGMFDVIVPVLAYLEVMHLALCSCFSQGNLSLDPP